MYPLAALLVCLAFVPATASADDYHLQDIPVGNRAMTLGGAFAAIANDPSGTYYNPAGLVDSSRASVSVSASLYGFDQMDIEGAEASESQLRIVPGAIGGIFTSDWDPQTRRSKFAGGFSVLVPTSGRRVLEAGDSGGTVRRGLTTIEEATAANDEVEDNMLWAGGAGAWSVTPQLSLGASAFLVHRTTRSTRHLSWVRRTHDEYAEYEAEQIQDPFFEGGEEVDFYDSVASLQVEDQAAMAILGAKWQPSKRLSFGASLRMPSVPIRSSGSARSTVFVDNPNETDARAVQDDKVKAETRMPAGLRLGGAFIGYKSFTLTCDLTVDGPSDSKRVSLEGALKDAFPVPRSIERNLLVNAACGYEQLVTDGMSVALGAYTDRSAQAADLTSLDYDGARSAGYSQDIDMYGGSVALGLFGEHSLTRIGVAVAGGAGHQLSVDPWTGTWRVHEIRRITAFLFMASTFRY